MSPPYLKSFMVLRNKKNKIQYGHQDPVGLVLLQLLSLLSPYSLLL